MTHRKDLKAERGNVEMRNPKFGRAENRMEIPHGASLGSE